MAGHCLEHVVAIAMFTYLWHPIDVCRVQCSWQIWSNAYSSCPNRFCPSTKPLQWKINSKKKRCPQLDTARFVDERQSAQVNDWRNDWSLPFSSCSYFLCTADWRNEIFAIPILRAITAATLMWINKFLRLFVDALVVYLSSDWIQALSLFSQSYVICILFSTFFVFMNKIWQRGSCHTLRERTQPRHESRRGTTERAFLWSIHKSSLRFMILSYDENWTKKKIISDSIDGVSKLEIMW